MAGVEGWSPGSTGYDLAITVVTIMFALAGMALGLGIAFRIRWLQDWGRDELVQSTINGALVGGLVLLFGSTGIVMLLMNDVIDVQNDYVLTQYRNQNPLEAFVKTDIGAQCSGALRGTGGIITPSCYALIYLYTIEQTLETVILDLSELIFILALLASLNINLIVVSFNFFAGLEVFVGIFSNMLEVFVMLATMTMVQAFFIIFVDSVAIPILLPVGLILRSFFMTRKLGGAIMAIAIGLGVVFPLTFVLDGRMMSDNYNVPANAVNGNITVLRSSLNNMTNFNDTFKEPLPGVRIPDLGAISKRMDGASSLSNSTQGAMQSLSVGMYAYMANTIMMIVILPFFNIIITLVSTRELASLFGSEFSGGSFGAL